MIYVALVHYPVLNRKKEIITSAVTNLDIHDIARLAAAYGLSGYFIVTPLEDQQQLVRELTAHWLNGSSPNSDRKTALSTVRISASVGETCSRIEEETGRMPMVIATSARRTVTGTAQRRSLSCLQLRKQTAKGHACLPAPILLLFGTASGLADSVFDRVTCTLEPIEFSSGYNHLSVRSAVAITLDRLFGMK